MLILFDIDGTLLRSHHAGLRAMERAGKDMFGTEFTFEGISTAGRLDPLIWRDLAARNGVDEADRHHDRFREVYHGHFEALCAEESPVYALPGVGALVEALAAIEDLTLGLLTGNYPETGRLKVSEAGLDPDQFVITAWGIDGGHRRELPPVAMQRYHDHHARAIEPHKCVIIGDTIHDVDCAHHNGCLALAVATGGFTRDQLEAVTPDLLVDDLSATDDLVTWIRQAEPVAGR